MSAPQFNPLGPAHFGSLNPEFIPPVEPRKRIGVFFATREGQTQRIAERVASDLLALGFDVDVVDVRERIRFPLSKYSAAVLAASVHSGNHESEMVKFVKGYRAELECLTTAFISVTLSQAGAERQDSAAAQHAKYVQDVDAMLSKFFNETQWTPTLVKPVAGALLYSRYNFLMRLIMKRIARKEHSDADTSRDYVYTDWPGLDKFVAEFAHHVKAGSPAALAAD